MISLEIPAGNPLDLAGLAKFSKAKIIQLDCEWLLSQSVNLVSVHRSQQTVFPAPFDLAEIEGAKSVGVDFLADIFSVSPDMGGHVIT